jgi:hypothetical protein
MLNITVLKYLWLKINFSVQPRKVRSITTLNAFRSTECSWKFIPHMFDREFSCARIKSEIISITVIGPGDNKELAFSKATFVVLNTEASCRGLLNQYQSQAGSS